MVALIRYAAVVYSRVFELSVKQYTTFLWRRMIESNSACNIPGEAVTFRVVQRIIGYVWGFLADGGISAGICRNMLWGEK